MSQYEHLSSFNESIQAVKEEKMDSESKLAADPKTKNNPACQFYPQGD